VHDICFYAPTLSYARYLSAKKDVYMYRFNELNPWEGEWKGESSHVLDIAFLFMNYNDYLEPGQKKQAENFAEFFLRFVNGQAPWQQWKEGQEVAMVMEGGKAELKKDVPSETGRREEFIKLGKEVGFDKLLSVWGQFASG